MKEFIVGKAIDYSHDGFGVIKNGKDVVFVSGLFLDEEAEVEVLYTRAGIKYAKVHKLIKKSEHRIQPKCLVCTACGGCQFHQLDYQSELDFKTKKVANLLSKIGGIKTKVNPTLGMENPYNYRNKIKLPVGLNGNKIVTGFYKVKSHEIVPIDECAIEDKRATKIVKEIKELMTSMKIAPYDEDRHTGIIRHLLIRTSYYFNEIMLTLVTSVDSFPSRNNFVKELIKRCPEITTVIQNINKRDTNVILGEKERVLYGKSYIVDSLCGIKFHISSKSFYQTNPVQTEVLYNTAMKFANLKKSDVVLDTYSGIGTIGLIASRYVKEVISVELVKEAHLNAIMNAKNNNINNFVAINEDATEFIKDYADEKKSVDVLFMDPPRKGSTPEFINCVKKLSPRRIVYISCDPSTLARDLKLFSDKYVVEQVQPVDMFCRTYHVETIVGLYLKGNNYEQS